MNDNDLIAQLLTRVAELEASLELRWADIAHLDTKLADALDRVEELERELGTLRATLKITDW